MSKQNLIKLKQISDKLENGLFVSDAEMEQLINGCTENELSKVFNYAMNKAV